MNILSSSARIFLEKKVNDRKEKNSKNTNKKETKIKPLNVPILFFLIPSTSNLPLNKINHNKTYSVSNIPI
jgi:hypothetical protein